MTKRRPDEAAPVKGWSVVETKVLKIEGMSCDHCKKAVTDALKNVAGVRSVEVDLRSGTAKVAYDTGKASEASLKEAVEEAGYEVAAL